MLEWRFSKVSKHILSIIWKCKKKKRKKLKELARYLTSIELHD